MRGGLRAPLSAGGGHGGTSVGAHVNWGSLGIDPLETFRGRLIFGSECLEAFAALVRHCAELFQLLQIESFAHEQ